MLYIIIKRRLLGKTCCLGELEMKEDDNLLFTCKTLEEEVEGIQSGQDLRIPSGDYEVDWYEASRFTPKLSKILNWTQAPLRLFNENVSKSRCILIHTGNTHKDTEGCILLGKQWGEDRESITQSRDAIKEFYTIINRRNSKTIRITILNRF